jgi:glycosyltransferase involved in cell wall biosynthesis
VAAVTQRSSPNGGRVLIIVQNLPVPLDRRVWMECNSLVASGFGVSVICPKGPGDTGYEHLDGVHIHRYRPPRQAHGALGYLREFLYCWLATLWLALRVRRREGFDVIQACNPPDTYFALALLFRPFGVRFVYDQHDLCPEVYLSRFERTAGLQLRVLRLLERATYRVADHVVTVNESYRAVATERGRLRPGDVTVVRSGPDPERMVRGVPEPGLRQGKAHLCCYLGVMGPQDGVDLLVRSIDVLVNTFGRDDCHFALLGFGDCYEDLRALSTELGLDDWITFTGRADDAMIRRYLSTADLGLDPDPKNPLNDISTMNKVLEYMAFELPVVTYDLTESRRSAEDAARYVTPNDVEEFAKAIDEMLDDPERRRRMGTEGRRRIESELGWHRQAARYVDVYERLLGPPALAGQR